MRLKAGWWVRVLAAAVLTNGPAVAIEVYGRIPEARNIPSAIGPLYYPIVYASYADAKSALEKWNGNYAENMAIYENGLALWRDECEKIRTEAEDKAEFKEYEVEELDLVPVYYEELKVYVFGWKNRITKEVVKVIPDYELPPKPEFSEAGYKEAESAYAYMVSDGLNSVEWHYLRLVLFRFRFIERGLGLYDDEDDITELVKKRLLTVADHKKSWKDAVTESRKKYDVAFTGEGLSYFNGLVDRCWDYRCGLVKYAYENSAITEAEVAALGDANDAIREAFRAQLVKPQDWSPHGPDELRGIFADFAVGEETAFEKFPYLRVLAAVPGPIAPPVE